MQLCYCISHFPYYAYNVAIIYVAIQPPTNVKAIALTPRSVEVTWNPSLSSEVTGYLISYDTSAVYVSSNKRTQSVSVNGRYNTSSNFSNLEEGTLYAITVQATTDDNNRRSINVTAEVTTYTDGK